jgi:hypothetical protein
MLEGTLNEWVSRPEIIQNSKELREFLMPLQSESQWKNENRLARKPSIEPNQRRRKSFVEAILSTTSPFLMTPDVDSLHRRSFESDANENEGSNPILRTVSLREVTNRSLGSTSIQKSKN